MFYYIVLLSLSLLFDFIQMCISQGIGLNVTNRYTGAHIFGLILMIMNLFIKLLIIFCSNKLFRQLGGTWTFSASFGMGTPDGGSAYANMSAGGEDYNAGLGNNNNNIGNGDGGYQEHEYKNPPATTGNHGTQHL